MTKAQGKSKTAAGMAAATLCMKTAQGTSMGRVAVPLPVLAI